MFRSEPSSDAMQLAAPGEVTGLLDILRAGDRSALDRLFAVVYQELHGLARRQLAGSPPGATLSPTALVHETYLKFTDARRLDCQDRRHLFAVAARAMRQIIIDGARRARAQKRWGPRARVTLDTRAPADGRTAAAAADLIALDDALEALEALDERLARVVELRYFAELSVEETADVLDLSPRTVKREWRKARAFLFATLEGTAQETVPR